MDGVIVHDQVGLVDGRLVELAVGEGVGEVPARVQLHERVHRVSVGGGGDAEEEGRILDRGELHELEGRTEQGQEALLPRNGVQQVRLSVSHTKRRDLSAFVRGKEKSFNKLQREKKRKREQETNKRGRQKAIKEVGKKQERACMTS